MSSGPPQFTRLFIFHDGENSFMPPTMNQPSMLYDETIHTALELMGVPRGSVNTKLLTVTWNVFLPPNSPECAQIQPSVFVKTQLMVRACVSE